MKLFTIAKSSALLFTIFTCSTFFSQGFLHDWSKDLRSTNHAICELEMGNDGAVYVASFLSVAKYNTQGQLLWSAQRGLSTKITDIAVDSSGAVYFAGSIKYSKDWDPSSNDHTEGSNINAEQAFVWKLNKDGDFEWVHIFRGGSSTIQGMDIDSDGNPHLVGRYVDSIRVELATGSKIIQNTNSGAGVFVTKLNSNGTCSWLKQPGGESPSLQFQIGLQDIAVAPDNSFVLIGKIYATNCSPSFDGTGTTISSQSVNGDAMILLYDANLNFTRNKILYSAIQVPNPDNPFYLPVSSHAFQVDIDIQGSIFCMGSFEGVLFESIIGRGLVEISEEGGGNPYFLLKMNNQLDSYWVSGISGVSHVSPEISLNNSGGCYMICSSYDSLKVIGVDAPQIFNSNGGFMIAEISADGRANIVKSQKGEFPNISLPKNDIAYRNGRLSWLADFGDSVEVNPTSTDEFVYKQNNESAILVQWEKCSSPITHRDERGCKEYVSDQGWVVKNSTDKMREFYERPDQCDSIVEYTIDLIKPEAGIIPFNNVLYATGQTGATYRWFLCSYPNVGDSYTELIGRVSDTLNVNMSGSYMLVLTVDGCSDTSDCSEYFVVETNELSEQIMGMQLYPNPTNENLNFVADYTGKVEILGLRGELIKSFYHPGGKSTINVQNQSPGVYFLRLAEGNSKPLKWVKN